MNFFQKNKSIIVFILLIGFLFAILLVFVPGVVGSKSNPTPTESFSFQRSTSVISTTNSNSTPRPFASLVGTQAPVIANPNSTNQTPTKISPQDAGSPPPHCNLQRHRQRLLETLPFPIRFKISRQHRDLP